MIRFTVTERADAVALAQQLDDVAAAARQSGISRQLLHTWIRKAGVTVSSEHRRANVTATQLRWEARRPELANLSGEIAERALDRVRAALADGRANDARSYAVTMAICVDKAQLLTGGATARMFEQNSRQALAAKLDELQQLRNRHASPA